MQVPVEIEMIVYKSCEDPVSNRSKDWGRPGYTHCNQPYSWRQLVYGHTHGASLFMDTMITKCPSSLVV